MPQMLRPSILTLGNLDLIPVVLIGVTGGIRKGVRLKVFQFLINEPSLYVMVAVLVHLFISRLVKTLNTSLTKSRNYLELTPYKYVKSRGEICNRI